MAFVPLRKGDVFATLDTMEEIARVVGNTFSIGINYFRLLWRRSYFTGTNGGV
jgi:hypothetical protein